MNTTLKAHGSVLSKTVLRARRTHSACRGVRSASTTMWITQTSTIIAACTVPASRSASVTTLSLLWGTPTAKHGTSEQLYSSKPSLHWLYLILLRKNDKNDLFFKRSSFKSSCLDERCAWISNISVSWDKAGNCISSSHHCVVCIQYFSTKTMNWSCSENLYHQE